MDKVITNYKTLLNLMFSTLKACDYTDGICSSLQKTFSVSKPQCGGVDCWSSTCSLLWAQAIDSAKGGNDE